MDADVDADEVLSSVSGEFDMLSSLSIDLDTVFSFSSDSSSSSSGDDCVCNLFCENLFNFFNKSDTTILIILLLNAINNSFPLSISNTFDNNSELVILFGSVILYNSNTSLRISGNNSVSIKLVLFA